MFKEFLSFETLLNPLDQLMNSFVLLVRVDTAVRREIVVFDSEVHVHAPSHALQSVSLLQYICESVIDLLTVVA